MILTECQELNDIDLLCQTIDMRKNMHAGIGSRGHVLQVIRKSFVEVTVIGGERGEITRLQGDIQIISVQEVVYHKRGHRIETGLAVADCLYVHKVCDQRSKIGLSSLALDILVVNKKVENIKSCLT